MSELEKKYTSLVEEAKKQIEQAHFKEKIVIQVGSATCEIAAGAEIVAEEFSKHIRATKRDDIVIKRVGCTGRCSLEPIVSVFIPNQKLVSYKQVNREKVHEIFISHIMNNEVVSKYQLNKKCDNSLKKSDAQKQLMKEPITHEFFEVYGEVPFYCSQSRIALRNVGLIDPHSIDEYIYYQGFSSLYKILKKNDPNWVVEEVKKSNLRGRGGAGFPTGIKWSFARDNKEKERYMICNADEGDPGAFMDRSMLESDPYSIIEGMMIAGFAIGAEQGFFYIRAEYPLAVKRINEAINVCRKKGLLGKNILGSNFNFDLEIRLGAGAFVCGEETALIHSIEGERGQPRIRPPFPAQKGLFDKPTIINNVETLANLPALICIGGENFAKVGSKKSGGTKVFAVSGKVKHTGLVEVPMKTSLREIVYDICGGIKDDKKLKAVQTGGPAGGCIPAEFIDTEVDYENILEIGSIMGSGGLIVLDEDDCMVDLAKFFITFSQNESCGKCSPCREGTLRMKEILERITSGEGTLQDLDKLERLAKLLQKASLCGLGRAAPNPILSTLKYFKEEYIAHVKDKKCPSKKCVALVNFEIDPNKCVGCTMCARNCPVNAISGNRKEVHVINQDICIKCGKCKEVCRFNAVINK
jgi:NADH:ubiquinone oxidoreductase subunit F (NADH-binding)/(2Fe-2S) ferredoxin/NAD-dependent dihydropyrimidine dehydrogenase PreA subunit